MPSERKAETSKVRVRARYIHPDAVRITHAERGATAFPADRPWLSEVLLPQPALAPGAARLRMEVQEGGVVVLGPDGTVVVAEAQPARVGRAWRRNTLTLEIPAVAIRNQRDRAADGVSLSFRIEPGEGFYGWGEWFSAFRRERGQVRLLARDAIAQLQPKETYSAIPVFFSSRGYAIWLLNSHESVWTIDPERGVLEVMAAGPGADYIVIQGPRMRDMIGTYTALTGRPPLLPRWALGLMATGYPQEPQNVVQARVQEHRQRKIPLDAVILDYHWEERFHNFRWRSSLFPDPSGMIADLRARGVRLGLIFTPFLNNRNRPGQRRLLQALAQNLPAGAKAGDERVLLDYDAARSRGFLAHPDTQWWFGAGGMFDFSNAEAAAWWNERMRPLYRQGVAFFKNDDGEYLPPDGRSVLGMTGREYHNLYGFFYGRAMYAAMEALDARRAFIYARSVWAGSQRYPALFLGDQKPTFEHIRSTMRAGLNLGLLGFAHWTADVFGLDGKTTPELHRRYAQWALLAPVARYFWRPPAIDNTRLPWSHGPDNEANFRFYADLRYRLLPHYHQLGWEAYRTGLPVMRPMLLEFPDDPRLADTADQVMLGDSLLLAPVLEPGNPKTGEAVRKILLPAGVPWHDFWSESSFPGGGVIDYPAPADCLPLLVRGGSIVPMGPTMASIADDHCFEELELHCYPPYPAKLVFYDDEGTTRSYQQGEFSTTAVQVTGDYARGRVRAEVSATEGGYPDQPTSRTVTVRLHRSPPPKAMRSSAGSTVLDFTYEAESQSVAVRLACPLNRATSVELDY